MVSALFRLRAPARLSALFFSALLLLAGTQPAWGAPAPVTVSLAVTTLAGTAISSAPTGTAVALTATLSSTAGTPYPGQVLFCDASATYCQNASLGTAQVVNTGGAAKATLTFTPGPGAHSYKAAFLGTNTYTAATSPAQSLTVTAPLSPAVTLSSSSGTAGTYNFTAQIAGTGPYTSPTGTVSLLDTTTNYNLGSAPLASGSSAFSIGSVTFVGFGGFLKGDLNNDGNLDIVGLSGSPTLGILLGNGNGTFTGPLSSAQNLVPAALADFNNDGKLDLIATTASGDAAYLLVGNGDGTFTTQATAFSACSGPYVVGDFNNDGNADLAAGCSGSSVNILLGNGDGTFAAVTPSTTFSIAPFTLGANRLLVGDFNADGKADLLFSACSGNCVLVLYRGNGDGTFQSPTNITVGPTGSGSALVAADFNGDGKLDIAVGATTVAGFIPQDVGVLLNNGDGTFAAPVLTPVTLTQLGAALAFNAVDLNSDGKADLVLADQRGLSLLFSNGDGTFTRQATSATVVSGPLLTGDFNGDGIPDISAGGRFYLGLTSETATTAFSNIRVGGSGNHAITATYNGDSLYSSSTSPSISVAASPISTALTLTANPTSALAGSPVILRATLTPFALGNLGTDGETVTFTNGSTTVGTAMLASGIATLTTSTLPLGTDSITASYPSDSNFQAAAASAVPVTITSPAPVAAAALSTSRLIFSGYALSSTSPAQTITIINTGQAALAIASIAATGDFAQTNTCTTSPLAPQGSCTIGVTFTPTAAGARSGTLTLTDNAPNSPQSISLTGNGVSGSTAVTLAITSAGSTVSTIPSGTPVTLLATLTATSGTPYPGQVMFCDATAPLCSNASPGVVQIVNTGGVAAASLKFVPGPGAHSYKAVFLGTRSYPQTSSSPQSLAVTAAASTTTALTSTGSSGSYTLSATVSGAGPYASPTGTFSFLDTTTGVTLGTSPVTPGTSTLSAGAGTSFSLDNSNGASAPVTGDFNGDGILDFAVGNSLGNAPVKILLGNGDGTFHPGPALTTSGTVVLAADFNNDGKLDLIVELNSAVTLLLGAGDGTFAPSPTPLPVCSFPSTIAAGDLNNDGNQDLVINCNGSLGILLGNGDATFTASTVSNTGFTGAMVIGDFDGDGNADVAALGFNLSNPANDYIAFFRGLGDGTLQPAVSSPLGWEEGGYLVAGDFNGDGKLDLAASTALTVIQTGPSGNALAVLLNHGNGTFAAPVLTPSPGGTLPFNGNSIQALTAADLNADGKPDLVLADSMGVYLMLGNGDATFTAVITSVPIPSSVPFGFLTTADLNGDGVPDILAINENYEMANVSLISATHTATGTLSNFAVGGSGTHSITATYSGDAAYAGSTSSAVTLTATRIATALTLAATPTSATGGTTVALKATLTPSSRGNLTTNGDTVTFTNGSTTLGTATLAAGVATLNTTALPVGTDSITASFPGDTNFLPSSAPSVQVTVTAPLLPAVTLSASVLSFPIQALSSTSAARTLTVTNSGQAPLTVSAISATGDFAQTNTCTAAPIPVQGTCTVSVTFSPTAAGTRQGLLTLTDNAANSPQSVNLIGIVLPVTLTPAASSLNIASAGGGASTTVQVSAVTGFSGTVALTCSVTSATPTTLLPTCALNPAQGTVSAGTTLSSTLTIATTGATARLAAPLEPRLNRPVALALAGLVFTGMLAPAHWRRRRLLTLVAAFGIIASAAGCGGHSSPPTTSIPGTPSGAYKVFVNANTGSFSESTIINLTVQ